MKPRMLIPFDGSPAAVRAVELLSTLDVQATLLNVITAGHPPLRRVPRALAEVLDRCLEKIPDNRYPTAYDLAEALSAVEFAEEAVYAPTVPLRIGPKGRALVVDDDELVRVILQAALADVGFEVDEAENGADAIRQLKRREYDAMFLDLLMPRVDGWTVLDFLRRTLERRPRNVYVTSGVRDLKLSDVDATVVTDVLKKPLHPRRMMDIAAQI